MRLVMTGTLDGKTAIVTGASAGIGRQTTLQFAQEGANTVVAARREQQLEELATEIEREHGTSCLVAPTDVTDEEQVGALVEAAVEEFGSLDVVVANAGIGREQVSVEEMSTDHYRSLMDVNTDGLFFTARESIPHLRESSGNLVVVGSVAGQYPVKSQPIYAASKWWARGFALSLSGSMERDEVGVTLVQPSEVRTEIVSPKGVSRAEQHEPGEVLSPEEVAEAILFAAAREEPATVAQLDLYRRDMLNFL